jgi:hypothetical protein
MTEITTMVESSVALQGQSIQTTTKKNLRRYLEDEFGDSLHFFPVESRLYIRPDVLTIDQLATMVVLLQRQVSMLVEQETDISVVKRAATILRNDTKQETQRQPWPPKLHELSPV